MYAPRILPELEIVLLEGFTFLVVEVVLHYFVHFLTSRRQSKNTLTLELDIFLEHKHVDIKCIGFFLFWMWSKTP